MTKKQSYEDMEKELDIVSASLGRFAHENGRFRSEARKSYERARSLENAIRHHAEGRCQCKTSAACLLALGRKVPTHPRPKYGQAMKQTAKKGGR